MRIQKSEVRNQQTTIRHFLLFIVSSFIASCASPTVMPPTPAPTIIPAQPTNPPTTQPTNTPTPIPPPKPKQLTNGGCCVNPFWSIDSTTVLYVDKPAESAGVGVWGVKLNDPTPHLLTSQIGVYSSDLKYVAYPKATQTIVAEIEGSKTWVIKEAEGRAISFAPNSKLISWQASSSLTNFDLRTTEVWVANVDGTNARKVISIFGGGASNWFRDSARMLVTYRKEVNGDPTLAILNIADGKLTPLVSSQNFRGTMISPEGGWVLYSIAFSGDAAQDGLWVIRTDGTDKRKLEVFGSYRWRSEGKLLLVPLENIGGKQSHRLVEVEAATGKVRTITDPALTSFRIANGDWALSPDGKHVVFLNADDRNLWTLELP